MSKLARCHRPGAATDGDPALRLSQDGSARSSWRLANRGDNGIYGSREVPRPPVDDTEKRYESVAPLWVNVSHPNRRDRPRGEIGVLTQVKVWLAIDNPLFLKISFQGSEYVGAMYFDDVVFCRQIKRILETMIGSSIQEIGDHDLSHTLEGKQGDVWGDGVA
jgi:hypothetical protein